MWEDLGIRKQHAAAETPKAEYEAPRNTVWVILRKKELKVVVRDTSHLVELNLLYVYFVYLLKRVAYYRQGSVMPQPQVTTARIFHRPGTHRTGFFRRPIK